LPFCDGREIRIAEQPERFAQVVVELLKNASMRDAIGSAARAEVVRNHSWNMVVARMEEILEQVVCSGRVSSGRGASVA